MYQISKISLCKSLFGRNSFTRWSLEPISSSSLLTSNNPSCSYLITALTSKFLHTYRKFDGEVEAARIFKYQMAQTLLHIASAGNDVDTVKILLTRQGSEKFTLEARNSYGETSLHLAAKNGSSEAARVLIDHGASMESKDDKGKTPLHLAVWYSVQTKDCSTFKTLLEFIADCTVKDNEGMTPLNHISQSVGNEKLHELLNRHLEEKMKRRAIEACIEAKVKMAQLEDEISKIVGLHKLKLQLRKWSKGMLLDEKRRSLGLKVATRRCPHMAFLGNPGTGKTMVARLLGRLMHMAGVLPTDKVTEVQRTDLVGEFIGSTGLKTRQMIEQAEGGILFVDEAYRLIQTHSSDDRDFGIEALEEIMSVMDAGKIVVIFAGYSEPMKRVIAANTGFSRRVTKFFVFDDFHPEELSQIVHLNMKNQQIDSILYGFKLHSSCTMETVAGLIEKKTTEKQRKEMNGGIVDTMLVNARENLDFRLEFESTDEDNLVTITLEDLEAGLKLLTP